MDHMRRKTNYYVWFDASEGVIILDRFASDSPAVMFIVVFFVYGCESSFCSFMS